MPIRRWHGWGAQCRHCKQFVDLGDVEAWTEREDVKISLGITLGDCIEEAITETCGCQRIHVSRTTPTTK